MHSYLGATSLRRDGTDYASTPREGDALSGVERARRAQAQRIGLSWILVGSGEHKPLKLTDIITRRSVKPKTIVKRYEVTLVSAQAATKTYRQLEAAHVLGTGPIVIDEMAKLVVDLVKAEARAVAVGSPIRSTERLEALQVKAAEIRASIEAAQRAAAMRAQAVRLSREALEVKVADLQLEARMEALLLETKAS